MEAVFWNHHDFICLALLAGGRRRKQWVVVTKLWIGPAHSLKSCFRHFNHNSVIVTVTHNSVPVQDGPPQVMHMFARNRKSIAVQPMSPDQINIQADNALRVLRDGCFRANTHRNLHSSHEGCRKHIDGDTREAARSLDPTVALTYLGVHTYTELLRRVGREL